MWEELSSWEDFDEPSGLLRRLATGGGSFGAQIYIPGCAIYQEWLDSLSGIILWAPLREPEACTKWDRV